MTKHTVQIPPGSEPAVYDAAITERLDQARDLTRSGADLVGDDLDAFERLEAEIDELRERKANIERITRLAGDPTNVVRGDGSNVEGAPGGHLQVLKRTTDPWSQLERASDAGEVRDLAAAAIEHDQIGSTELREHTTNIVRSAKDPQVARWAILASDPSYESAWLSLMRNPSQGHLEWNADEQRAYKAVQQFRSIIGGTPSAGGYLLPTHLDPAVMHSSDLAVNPFRRLASVETIATDQYNGVVSGGVTATYATELAVVTEGTPTFSPAPIPMHRYHAYVTSSLEALGDIQNVGAEVSAMFADAVFEMEAAAFVNGTGTNEPTGIVTALAGALSTATRQTTCATNSAITTADFEKAQLHLAPRFRNGASWAMNLRYINEVRALGDENVYSGQTTDGTQRPRQFLDHPLYEASEMTSTLSAATNNAVVYGDFARGYKIVDRVGTSIAFVDHVLDPTTNRPIGAKGWYLFGRNGADVVNDAAFTLLVNPSSVAVL